MARFYRIQIGSIFLTRTGLAGGIPCKLTVSGADNLLLPFAGITEPSADGTPYTTVFETDKGKNLEISVETLTADVWQDLTEIINDAINSGSSLTVIGTGDIGNFNVSVVPQMPNPFAAESFINGRIRNASFRFMTT